MSGKVTGGRPPRRGGGQVEEGGERGAVTAFAVRYSRKQGGGGQPSEGAGMRDRGPGPAPCLLLYMARGGTGMGRGMVNGPAVVAGGWGRTVTRMVSRTDTPSASVAPTVMVAVPFFPRA